MVLINNSNKSIDFSFIPSLECNITCPFCMYDAGPNMKKELDLEKTKKFIKTFNWSKINSIGFYGGEPSINLPLYQKYVDLIPTDIPKFIISNGTWSLDFDKTLDFLEFLFKNKLFLVVSGTPFHKKHQSRDRLIRLKNLYPDYIKLKDDDIIHPMGRAAFKNWDCNKRCLHGIDFPMRLGLFPSGNILFQYCDGVYPVVQTYNESFNGLIRRSLKVIKTCSKVIRSC